MKKEHYNKEIFSDEVSCLKTNCGSNYKGKCNQNQTDKEDCFWTVE